jgi:hypothetical protein
MVENGPALRVHGAVLFQKHLHPFFEKWQWPSEAVATL